MFAWQFQKALHAAERHGWTRFVSMQNHLNLIYREEEREMLPLCRDQKIGVIPYSPLASGRLTRDRASESTLRSETDQVQKWKYDATAETHSESLSGTPKSRASVRFRASISRSPGCCRRRR
jgi:aryl-alcohol dehydrogenase-like predicted oxidoreductase